MELRNDTPYSVERLPTTGPDEHPVLTLMVKGTFDIHPSGLLIPAAEQLPVNFGDELYDPETGSSVRYESDVVPFKPRADIALVGQAYAPGGRPTSMVDVTLRVGHLRRTLRVIGDRTWIWRGRLLPVSMSSPLPFTQMPLVYERAFGGIDTAGGGYCKENLVGRGFIARKKKQAITGVPLPNIEDPTQVIRAWHDQPRPVGFGFYGKAWSPRAECLGTYDARWRQERAPRPPHDFNFAFYNAAHPDLQVPGYLQGNETVELQHLTPEGYLTFALPGIQVVATVTKSSQALWRAPTGAEAAPGTPAEESVEPIAMHLDTLCLMPDERRLYLVWRGLCRVLDMTALEVTRVHITERPV